MEKLTLFYLPSCPHCRLAIKCLEELCSKDPAYASIPVERIDESVNKKLASQYDYWYVPCFYLGQRKLFEGHMEKEDVRRVLDEALVSSQTA